MKNNYLALCLVYIFMGGCAAEGSATFGEYEGDEPMECNDGADNDRDGLFDCADEGCAGAAVCSEQDSGSEPDRAEDSDTVGGSDSNADTTIASDSGEDTVTSTNTETTLDTGTVSDTGSGADSGGGSDTGTGSADDVDTNSDSGAQVDTQQDTETDGPPIGTSDTVAPMPIISRDVPSFSNSRWPASANDDNYDSFFLTDVGLPVWLAYDLSQVPAVQRGWVVVLWLNDSYNYSADFARVIRAPSRYTIDAHAAPGGSEPPAADDAGWVTLVNMNDQPNRFHSRQHVVNLTDGDTVYNWVRLYVTETTDSDQVANPSMAVNMDIHDAHLGNQDNWLFAGDSITNAGMVQKTSGDINFAELINNSLPDHFPVQENCGVGGFTVGDGAEYVPTWLAHFPGRYVTLGFGTNDTGAGTSSEEFYADYELMVNAVLDAGKIPIIPTIPWFNRVEAERVPMLNDAIADLKEAYPEIIDGPDFWTHFMENPHLISDDNLHPSAEGYRVLRRLWAEKMLEEVYQMQTD